MPPYIIFSDKTLVDMCIKLPFTKEEMLNVTGVGENKYERYGVRFMQCIIDSTDAIKDKYSVAVDTISEEYRLVGDLRLVKYTRFLLDEFTPLHDELCYEEGRLMKAYVTGDEDAEKVLKAIGGRMKKMYRKYFAL